MIQHNVVDFTGQYDNLLMSYGEHSQIQRYTYGLDLISMDFIGLDDHDNGWIPSGTETAYVDQWDTLYYQHDDLGTENKVIGSSGKTSAHYNYDEFGRPLGAVKLDPNWSGPDNAISYTGYTYDHFAELYYAQARYYMPEVGRFISEDRWAGDLTQPGTLNPYPYVLNNPQRYVDPLGMWIEDCPVVASSPFFNMADPRTKWLNDWWNAMYEKVVVWRDPDYYTFSLSIETHIKGFSLSAGSYTLDRYQNLYKTQEVGGGRSPKVVSASLISGWLWREKPKETDSVVVQKD